MTANQSDAPSPANPSQLSDAQIMHIADKHGWAIKQTGRMEWLVCQTNTPANLIALARALRTAPPAPAGWAGYCAEGDRCLCGGDTQRVREGCGNWRAAVGEPSASPADTTDYKAMFEDACLDLAAIHTSLGLSDDEAGGAAPILLAIEELKTSTSPAALTLADAVAHIERKAEEYANRFGYSVAGALSFGSQVKMDHYTSLTELADELRELAPQPSKYPEAGHGTQYHCGAPGLLQFARALLAAEQPSAPFSPDWAGYRQGLADGQAEQPSEDMLERLRNPMPPFGMLVRTLRIVSGSLLMDMAKDLQLAPSELSAYECGRKPIPEELPRHAANYFQRQGVGGTLPALSRARYVSIHAAIAKGDPQ